MSSNAVAIPITNVQALCAADGEGFAINTYTVQVHFLAVGESLHE